MLQNLAETGSFSPQSIQYLISYFGFGGSDGATTVYPIGSHETFGSTTGAAKLDA